MGPLIFGEKKTNLNQTMKKKRSFHFPLLFSSPCCTLLLHSGINSPSGRPVLPGGAAKSICWSQASKKDGNLFDNGTLKAHANVFTRSLARSLSHTHTLTHTKELQFRRISQIQEVVSTQRVQQLRWCKGGVCWWISFRAPAITPNCINPTPPLFLQYYISTLIVFL